MSDTSLSKLKDDLNKAKRFYEEEITGGTSYREVYLERIFLIDHVIIPLIDAILSKEDEEDGK